MSEELKAAFAKTPMFNNPDPDNGGYRMVGFRLPEALAWPEGDHALRILDFMRDALSRTPTEPGEAEVERLIHEFRRLPLDADAGCDKLTDSEWRTVARAAIAALRSTTPASDVVEAESYASDFVKGEAPADVSRAAVDDDALVERLRAAERNTPPLAERKKLFANARDRIQSLQASIRVKDEALTAIVRITGKNERGLIDWQRALNRAQAIATEALA